MNRVERGSGMNKEHFIIELKIYLKALNPKDQAIILAKYKALFDARVAEGETEEQVAKSLGKPRVIAEEILKEQGIELTERKIMAGKKFQRLHLLMIIPMKKNLNFTMIMILHTINDHSIGH